MTEFTITPPHDPNEEELRVGPIEAESAAEVLARLEHRDRELRDQASEPESVEPPSEKPTFTLRQMLIVVTVLSVWLGVLRWLNALNMSILSGLTGIAALVGMFWISTQEDQPKIVRVIWWGMLLVYVTCSVATLIR
jgi:hypothetical protein